MGKINKKINLCLIDSLKATQFAPDVNDIRLQRCVYGFVIPLLRFTVTARNSSGSAAISSPAQRRGR